MDLLGLRTATFKGAAVLGPDGIRAQVTLLATFCPLFCFLQHVGFTLRVVGKMAAASHKETSFGFTI